VVRFFEAFGTRFYFGKLGPRMKIIASHIRYYHQKSLLKKGNHRIYIAGLPKSGTTWLESILTNYLDTSSVLPPEITNYEMKMGESHNFIPNSDVFRDLNGYSCIIKTHAKKSEELLNLLVRYEFSVILLTREIDEVLGSHIHYARNTKHHPDYPALRHMDADTANEMVKEKYSDVLFKWVNDWKELGAFHLTYEELLNNTVGVVRQILQECNIPVNESRLQKAIEYNSIKRMRDRAVNKKFFRGSKA
jgi:hypothetical protein